MTIPVERTRAVLAAGDFLDSLGDPSATPRVPKAVREMALRIARHYPWRLHLLQSAEALPLVWGPPE